MRCWPVAGKLIFVNQDFIYLASNSPRRRELLSQIGLPFQVQAADIPELRLPGEPVRDFVARMALAKASAVSKASGATRPVLGADTVVVVDAEMLGKPADREQALAMLAKLSGRDHEVFTAVAVVGKGKTTVEVDVSRVWFRVIDAAERAAYWDTGEPQDKAGAYAVQGIGAVFISRLEGSFSGVMGLPLHLTANMLSLHGIRVPAMTKAQSAHA